MRGTVVLYPAPGAGHLVPMVELAGLFLRHGMAVTIVAVQPPSPTGSFSSEVSRAVSVNPSIGLHVLPVPAATDQDDEPAHHLVRFFDLIRRTNAPLRDYLRSVGLRSVRALVLDMFCVGALDVAAELGVPAYFFYTAGASSLAVSLYMPYLKTSFFLGLGETGDAPLSFPGNLPLKPRDLGDVHSEVFKKILCLFERLPESRGILVNTFEWLEARALRALRDGECVPGRPTPPVYTVGPLVSSGGAAGGENARQHECLAWLDAQPEKSVVFLCFGSMGTFPVEQLHEIGVGLEMSRHRFLWVVRSPSMGGHEQNVLAGGAAITEPDLGALLPEGFEERTRGRGLVVKAWAPQVDVLRHSATGAFMTHCGWNSTLEAVTAGLPLLCWPLYAEQGQNKVFIVEELKIGVEMAQSGDGMVTAEEVTAKVRSVMEPETSEVGRALRERAMAAKEKALEAMQEGGSSQIAFDECLRDMDNVSLYQCDD